MIYGMFSKKNKTEQNSSPQEERRCFLLLLFFLIKLLYKTISIVITLPMHAPKLQLHFIVKLLLPEII